ncbi:hypothetical protein [Conexibacter sp. DBS9H8]|uniref:hypothetical protein n=1 Tax=Conexibacter sp. DBS9H8 TaxID=2937801 RepID=UPI002010C3F1|nr:hypothetical protein [Conexibacter sp. DBS9H8]
MRSRCAELADLGVQFFVAAAPANLANFNLTPLGVDLTPLPFLARGWRHDDLLRLWNQMDAYAFGPREMPMPNWVLVDHALMASGLIIAACDQANLEPILTRFRVGPNERHILELVLADVHAQGYTGPVPIAGYCAAPTAQRGRWMGWSMCSAIPHAGLGFAVKAIGLETYRAEVVTGVTQYDNLSLRAHVKFGPARIEAATVDLHTAAGSFVYATDVTAWRAGAATPARPLSSDGTPAVDAGASPGEPTLLVAAGDRARHLELQATIDAGRHRVEIIEPGLIIADGQSLVPVRITPIEDGVDHG